MSRKASKHGRLNDRSFLRYSNIKYEWTVDVHRSVIDLITCRMIHNLFGRQRVHSERVLSRLCESGEDFHLPRISLRKAWGISSRLCGKTQAVKLNAVNHVRFGTSRLFPRTVVDTAGGNHILRHLAGRGE